MTNSEQYETHLARMDEKLAYYSKECPKGNWQCYFTDPLGMPADYFSPARYGPAYNAENCTSLCEMIDTPDRTPNVLKKAS
jgi:hypothetical protein